MHSSLLFISMHINQAYFFTDFPATTETGISETLSLGKKFLSLAKKSLSLAKNPRVLYITRGHGQLGLSRHESADNYTIARMQN